MPLLQTSHLFAWRDTEANLPAGYSRATGYDDRMLLGDGPLFTGTSQTGGGTHDHTVTSSHTGVAHTHTIVCLSGASGVTQQTAATTGSPTARVAADPTHTHANSTSASATLVYDNENITVDATEAIPLHFEVLMVRPDSGDSELPEGGICFFNGSVDSGFHELDGNDSYPDWDSHYIRGAGSGSDPNASAQGSSTHTHTGTGHTHSVQDHSHGNSTSGNANANYFLSGTGSVVVRGTNHHTLSCDSLALGNTNSTTPSLTTASNELDYFELKAGEATSDIEVPAGAIVGWDGAITDIPNGWAICNGKRGTPNLIDRFIKVTTGSAGGTGNASAHDHDLAGHLHTGPAHGYTGFGSPPTHGVTEVAFVNNVTDAAAGGTRLISGTADTHTHVGWRTNSTTPTTTTSSAETSDSVSAVDARPSYRTIVWLMATHVTYRLAGKYRLDGKYRLGG